MNNCMPMNLTTQNNRKLYRDSLPKLNPGEIDQLNRHITKNEIEHVIKPLPTNKSPERIKANIIDKYRCKNSQQNLSKPNPTTYKKNYTPWRWD